MSTLNQISFSTGTANSQAITFYAGRADFESTRYVTLSQDYTRVIPVGFPRVDAGAPISASKVAYPQTIASGQRVQFFAPEAARFGGSRRRYVHVRGGNGRLASRLASSRSHS
jgi:hypothetical protein